VIINKDFEEFVGALERNHVEFLIVGAFALAFHGWPRATGDIDFWIRPTDENAEAVLRAIVDFGFKSLGLSRADILSGQVIQLGYEPVRIDLLTELEGISGEEVWASRVPGPFGEREVFYLGRAAFIKNKRAIGRAKDLADVEALGEPPVS
jgi:hypothetical protein